MRQPILLDSLARVCRSGDWVHVQQPRSARKARTLSLCTSKRSRQRILIGSHPCLSGTIRHARATASYLPNEIVRPYSKTSGYELRLYQPRYVLQTAYSSRQQAYLLFDQYLTGALCQAEALLDWLCQTFLSLTGALHYYPMTGKNAEKANLEAPAPVVMRHDPAAVRCF